jgi:DNA-binding response OmpR family regulator
MVQYKPALAAQNCGAPMLSSEYILVVDDDASIRALTISVLEDAGFAVREARNGSAAMAVVEAGPPPCLVILDLQMPVMDGRAFFRALRAAGHAMPVLVVSAYGADAARIELGADASIGKPFDIDDLLGRAQDLLQLTA